MHILLIFYPIPSSLTSSGGSLLFAARTSPSLVPTRLILLCCILSSDGFRLPASRPPLTLIPPSPCSPPLHFFFGRLCSARPLVPGAPSFPQYVLLPRQGAVFRDSSPVFTLPSCVASSARFSTSPTGGDLIHLADLLRPRRSSLCRQISPQLSAFPSSCRFFACTLGTVFVRFPALLSIM